jgi:hypothetical protein
MLSPDNFLMTCIMNIVSSSTDRNVSLNLSQSNEMPQQAKMPNGVVASQTLSANN